jgi:hypothetical protein
LCRQRRPDGGDLITQRFVSQLSNATKRSKKPSKPSHSLARQAHTS